MCGTPVNRWRRIEPLLKNNDSGNLLGLILSTKLDVDGDLWYEVCQPPLFAAEVGTHKHERVGKRL